jgi:hypothetical protein
MFRLNSGLGAGLRKAFQPLVPIALNHLYSVWLHYTIRQRNKTTDAYLTNTAID